MRLLLRLIAPVTGLSITPWLLLGMGYSATALLAHPWFATLVVATMALSIYVLASVTREEQALLDGALSEALAACETEAYSAPLSLGAGFDSPAVDAVENMRKTLRARADQAIMDLAAMREAS